jgi:peptide/nickel transport system substrate-binding protein
MLSDRYLSSIFLSLLDEDALHRRSASSFLLACQASLSQSTGKPIAHIFLLEETMKTHLYKLMILFTVVALGLSACAQKETATSTSAPAAPKATDTVVVVPTEKPAEEPTKAPVVVKATDTSVPPTATAVPPTPTEAPPAEPKVATFIWTQEFDTLNPIYTNMWFSSITFQLWDCYAWTFTDQNIPVPVLVKEMPSADNGGISADGKTITLKLREDLVWSDGTPLTSEDFMFTYEMTINTANSVATQAPYDLVEKMETPDKYTVVITFKDPYAPWMGTLWKGIIPAHILKPVFEAAGNLNEAEWNRKPTVGCGPYVFKEWESGSYARFVVNEKYWAGKPKLDEIFIRFVPDDASQIAALTNGEGDLGTFFANSDVPGLEDAGVKVYRVFSGYNEGIYFNLGDKGNPGLKDQKVRQAIAYALDRASFAKDVLLGLTIPAATDWDNTPWVDPSIQPYPYDPEMAKKLLDEAGWVDSNGDGTRDKDGVELVLKYGTTTREVRKDMQAVAQQQLQEVGIKVDLLNYDSDLFFAGYDQNGPAAHGDLDMFEYSSTANFPDPDISEWLCNNIPSDEVPAGSNWMYLCDQKLNDLFMLQITQVDFSTRQKTFNEITKYIFDQAYWVGLWQDPDLWGVNKRLTNVKISGATPFFNIMEWDLSAP